MLTEHARCKTQLAASSRDGKGSTPRPLHRIGAMHLTRDSQLPIDLHRERPRVRCQRQGIEKDHRRVVQRTVKPQSNEGGLPAYAVDDDRSRILS